MLMAVALGSQPENARLAQDRAWAQWALQQWAAFPVSSGLRPLILTGPPTRMDHGFRSGEAKLAFLYGDIQTEVQLPGPAGFRTLVGWSRTVTVRLASPLGERVVVDLDASPLMVLAHDPA